MEIESTIKIEEYLDETLRLPKCFRPHIIHYVRSHDYFIDKERSKISSKCAYLVNNNGSCQLFWRDDSIIIDEAYVEDADDSPILGDTVRSFIELDDNNLMIEISVDSGKTRYTGTLHCDGAKIGGLFYGQNHYQNLNLTDIESSRSMASFVTDMAEELTARTVYLVAKRKDFNSEKEKIVKLP